MNRSAHGVAAQVGQVQALGGDSLPRKSGVAVHDDRHNLQLPVAPDARLLGASAAHGHRVHRLQVAGIRNQVNAHLLTMRRGEDSRRSDVILHVAAAQHAARIDILEPGKNLRRRTVHYVEDDVEAAAMTHGQHGLLRPIFRGRVQDLVQQGN